MNNPTSSGNIILTVGFYYANGTLRSNKTRTISFSPASLASASVASSSSTVGVTGVSLIVTMKLTNALPSTGSVRVFVPAMIFFASTNDYEYMFDSTSLTCTSISGMNTGSCF